MDKAWIVHARAWLMHEIDFLERKTNHSSIK
ncbi:MAG: hypothetical protein RI922_1484 [Bacteroidota bacterium]|jgi:hypothetical protein